MRLYVTPAGRWAGTQADAKVIGKEDGGWIEQEVATDKPGLLDFLNTNRVGASPLVAVGVGLPIGKGDSFVPGSLATALNHPESAHINFDPEALIEEAKPGQRLFDSMVDMARAAQLDQIKVEEWVQQANPAQLRSIFDNSTSRMRELLAQIDGRN